MSESETRTFEEFDRYEYYPEEIERMRRCAESISRRAAIVAALAFEGLRTCEIARIRTQDLSGTKLKVRGKGRKSYDQTVTLTESTADLIRSHASGYWLFIGYRGKHITTRTIRRIFDQIRDCAGNRIPGRAAHVARHTYAKQAIKAGKSVQEVKKHLRHKRKDMTLHYIQASRIIAVPTEAEA